MSSTEMQDRTYGGWTKPRLAGLGGLSLGVSLLLLAGALSAVLLMVFRHYVIAGVVVGATLLLVVALTVRSSAGRSLLDRAALAVPKRAANRRQRTVLAQGPAGMTPDGHCRLPGLLARSTLTEGTDLYGVPFGLLHVPQTSHWTVVIQCAPAGLDLIDKDEIDRHVAFWGGWMAHLGQEHPDVVGAQVVVETSPDPGVRLRRQLAEIQAPHRPELVADVVRQLEQEAPAGTPQQHTAVTLTFTGRTAGMKQPRSREEMITRIGNALPGIVAFLSRAGAGSSPHPMRAADIIDMTRTAFDPVVAEDIQRARDAGGTGLTWDEAGPAWQDDRNPGWLVHDRAVSRVWQMTEAPTGLVTHHVLKSLLSASRDVPVKRVTMLFRPLDAASAARAVDQEARNARFVANNGSRSGEARNQQRLAKATQVSREEANGAGLVRFGLIVTATVLRPRVGAATPEQEATELARLDAAVRGLAPHARIRLRVATHTQAAAFTAGLPVGLVLPAHMAVPAELREAL